LLLFIMIFGFVSIFDIRASELKYEVIYELHYGRKS
jgi:hypothetical protein